MIIDPQVQGRVNVLLNDVPWDQALDQILRSNKLGYTVEGNIIRIAPLAVLADEQAAARRSWSKPRRSPASCACRRSP